MPLSECIPKIRSRTEEIYIFKVAKIGSISLAVSDPNTGRFSPILDRLSVCVRVLWIVSSFVSLTDLSLSLYSWPFVNV